VGSLLTLFDFQCTLVLRLLHPHLLLQAKLQDVCFPPLVVIPSVGIGVVGPERALHLPLSAKLTRAMWRHHTVHL